MESENKYIPPISIKAKNNYIYDQDGKVIAVTYMCALRHDKRGGLIDDTSAKTNAAEIEKRYNAYGDLVKALSGLEDIISGIEAQADNKGIDLSEARHWWVDARKLLDKLEDEK